MGDITKPSQACALVNDFNESLFISPYPNNNKTALINTDGINTKLNVNHTFFELVKE